MGFLLYAFPPFAFLSRAFPLLPPLLPAGYLYVWDAVDGQSSVPGDPPHDGTDITRQVPAAGSGCKILLRVQPVSVNHEVSVGQIAYRGKTGKKNN